MPDQTGAIASAGSALTDGGGISALTGSKVLKDAVADVLLSLPPALAAVNVFSIDDAFKAPMIVIMTVGTAVLKVVYRVVLKWATT
jgi:hypothetical protein